MKLFVIIATVVACACAAPTVELQHPSPVNPNVLVEIKPEEKIILITDPKELAKFKRETKQPLYPTVLPQIHVHHITKRDHKPGQEFKPTATNDYVSGEGLQNQQILPIILPQVVVVKETPVSNQNQEEIPSPKKDNKESVQDKIDEKKDTAAVYQKPQGLPAIFSPSNKAVQQKRDIPVPLTPKHHHTEESPKESQEEKHKNHEVVEKLEGLSAISSPSYSVTQQKKRDIPVPLVSKYHHLEESPKESNENLSQENKKVSHSENQYVTSDGFQKAQTLPLIVKETSQDTLHQRDISMHHHLEESPKEHIQKEFLEDKEETHSENQYVTEELQKSQIIPLILKETSPNTQLKRDIPVPLVPKYHHPEESPKENDEKETLEDKKKESHHEVLQKHQTSPVILKESAEDTQQHKRDIPVPLVPKYHHPEEFPKESNEKEVHDDKIEENHHEGLQKLQTSDDTQHNRDIPLPLVAKYHQKEDKKEIISDNHDYPAEDLQKPQTSPPILKETLDETQQQKRDTTVPEVVIKDSLKENINVKVSHEDKAKVESENHNVPLTHTIPQTHSTQNHDHVNTEGFHKPQNILSYHHEQLQQPGFHKIQIHSNHHKQFPQKDNENNEHDIPSHHLHQTDDINHQKQDLHVSAIGHHHEETRKEFTENIKAETKQINGDHPNIHEVQIEPINHDLRIQSKNTANESNEKVKKSADDHPNIHDIQVEDLSGSVYQKPLNHHTLPVPKESNENKEMAKKSTDNQPNVHEVQVEDLSGSIYQKPVHHDLTKQNEHKSNILDDPLSAHDSTSEHPILRRRPVPVAELFARAHDN